MKKIGRREIPFKAFSFGFFFYFREKLERKERKTKTFLRNIILAWEKWKKKKIVIGICISQELNVSFARRSILKYFYFYTSFAEGRGKSFLGSEFPRQKVIITPFQTHTVVISQSHKCLFIHVGEQRLRKGWVFKICEKEIECCGGWEILKWKIDILFSSVAVPGL